MDLLSLPQVSVPLPWHADLWQRLQRQLDDDTLPHALLLAGPRGTGKARLAVALSRLLLCQRPAYGANCGDCHPCRLSASGSHGDWCWLQPEEKSRVIKIDQVRAAVEFAVQTPGFGSRKVMVLSPADALNTNAANALLKCLEEPAAGTFIVLVCHRLHAVPATIRSRCQLLRLAQPDEADSIAWLAERTGDQAMARRLLQAADGSPLLAELLFTQGTAQEAAAQLEALVALGRGQLAPAEVAAVLAPLEPGELLTLLRQSLQRTLRDAGTSLLTSAAGRDLFHLLDELQRLQGAMDGGANPNRQLLLESLLMRYQGALGARGNGGSIEAHG